MVGVLVVGFVCAHIRKSGERRRPRVIIKVRLMQGSSYGGCTGQGFGSGCTTLNFLFVWLPSVKVYCQLSNNIAKGVDYQSFFVTLHSYLG